MPATAANVSCCCREGHLDVGVPVDWGKHKDFLETAACHGADDPECHNLGVLCMMEGNPATGMCHFRVAASCGDDDSLKAQRMDAMMDLSRNRISLTHSGHGRQLKLT